MVETFQKLMSFLAGMLILIGALVDECPRIPAAVVGLILMGVFTVPDAMVFFKRKFSIGKEDE
jgi:hypothetical protein